MTTVRAGGRAIVLLAAVLVTALSGHGAVAATGATAGATSTVPTERRTTPYPPEEICGRDFAVLDSHSFGADVGAAFLLYSPANGTLCASLVKYSEIGIPSPVGVILQLEGADRLSDVGMYRYYAGPVKARARGGCVRWGGVIGDERWISPPEHCSPTGTTIARGAGSEVGYDMSGRCVDVFGLVEHPNGNDASGGAQRVHCG